MSAARLLLLVSALLALSCAGQIPPGGGPVDTTPPSIVAADPVPGTLLFRGDALRLGFSEYVDRRSLEESVFLSPPLGRLTFDWSGTEVTIRFRDSLRANTTYILTVGTDVRDIREKGNRMSAAFALPFSTGDHLDSAAVAGRVFDAEPQGVMIFAYALDGRAPDTLNPSTLRPDFVTQTGKDGSFRLPCLPLGAFRLFAVVDEYKNLLYDRQIDRFGVATGDVRLSAAAPVVGGLQFRLTREDTTAPFVSSVRAVDRSHLVVRFSESLDTLGVRLAAFAALDTLSLAPLGLLEATITDTSGREVELVTAPQESAATYRVSVTGVQDRAGNPLAPGAAAGVVGGSAIPDTLAPVTAFPFVDDSTRNVGRDGVFAFSWKEPVRRSSAERALALADSAGTPVPFTVRWDGSLNATLRTLAPLSLGSSYVLRVRLDSVMDATGNARRDSVRAFHFRTATEERLTSIAGSVVVDTARPRAGTVLVDATRVGSSPAARYRAAADTASAFLFPAVEEGRYAFELFRDADGNGTYGYGAAYPYRPSEPFGVFPETIKVRARWPVEGVLLRIPEQP